MATRKRVRKKAGKPARKAKATRKAAKKKAVKKKAARRAGAARRAPRAAAAPAMSRIGMITHTEIASADPAATQEWCEQVLGWKFAPPMETPGGPYRMWAFENKTGGGIRTNNPPEAPGSIPYCEVADIRQSFDAAIAAGAQSMLPPQALEGGMGWIAIVSAPGGVAVGFWAPK